MHAGEARGWVTAFRSSALCQGPSTPPAAGGGRKEEKNGNKAVHGEKQFFLAPEGTRKGNACIVVGTRQSSLENGLTCWSMKNALSVNSFENTRREM